MENRLDQTSSPYLKAHGDNPIDWQPWDDQALKMATDQDKPILLSIGYSACHWCHVMADESFSDDEVANLINDYFVPIKVDREENPDVDEVYQSALSAMGQQGGWPLTLFLTPDRKPFFGGTYFPKEAAGNRPGFKDVLRNVRRQFDANTDQADQLGEAVTKALSDHYSPGGNIMRGGKDSDQPSLSMGQLATAARQLFNQGDDKYGGFGDRPKFPQIPALSALLAMGAEQGEDAWVDHVIDTLRHICTGGLYDPVDGGFFRYCVDQKWQIPHFEKMLNDNAQILPLLARAWQITGDDLFQDRANGVVEWMLDQMRMPIQQSSMQDTQLFAASRDAVSEGQLEGRYYTITQNELREILSGKQMDVLQRVYTIRPGGNWDDAQINDLNHLYSTPEKMDKLTDSGRVTLQSALNEIKKWRDQNRDRPKRDNKGLTDWNALTISGLAQAGFIFGEPKWVEIGEQTYHSLRQLVIRDGNIYHQAGADHPATLDDIAFVGRAAYDLYAVTGTDEFLDHARNYLTYARTHFQSNDGVYQLSQRDDLPVVPVTIHDRATPNGQAVILDLLSRMRELFPDDRAGYQDQINGIIHAFADRITDNPAFPPSRFVEASALTLAANRITLLGDHLSNTMAALMDVLRRSYLPLTVFHHESRDDRTGVQLCQDQTCGPVIDNPRALTAALNESLPMVGLDAQDTVSRETA
jgi:uncharacterized protein YyaL (SSP411 family)